MTMIKKSMRCLTVAMGLAEGVSVVGCDVGVDVTVAVELAEGVSVVGCDEGVNVVGIDDVGLDV
jgi:hypothetical protein